MQIIVLTSNQYVNVLAPFAHFWQQFAGDARPVVVAGYDVAPPELPPRWEFQSIGRQRDYTWSGGLLRLLEMRRQAGHDEPFLLLLEDYFLTAPVDWAAIDEAAFLMQIAPGIDKIDLSGDRLKTPHTVLGPTFVKSDTGALFQMSMQAALWHPRMLKKYLRSDENAWQAEKAGTKRVNHALEHTGDGPLILGLRTPPLIYINAVGGEGNHPGVISPKYMPEWMREECAAEGWING